MAEKAKFDREAAFKSIIGAGRQSENAVVAEEKNTKKNSDRVQRAYYLDRDIDKALRRMALEEGKNLTESVNDLLHLSDLLRYQMMASLSTYQGSLHVRQDLCLLLYSKLL